MKFLMGLIAGLICAPSVWAASPFLPISATNTFRSGERAIVEAAIAQAETEGKYVFIDMAAAWCGPCLALEKGEEANKAVLAPILKHFVYVKLEEMHLEMMGGADFMVTEIPWFPSLFIYNPANKRWSFLYASEVDSLKTTLEDYLAHESLSKYYVDQLNADLAGKDPVSDDTVMAAVVPLSTESSGADLLATTTAVTKMMTDHPDRFAVSIADMELEFTNVYIRSIEMGKLTFEQIRAADPMAFAEIKSTPLLLSRIMFRAPIGYAIRTRGNKVASDMCATLSGKVGDALKEATPEVQRKFLVARDLQCLLLQVQLKEKNGADVMTFEATLTDAERVKMAYELSKVYALTGTSFDKATYYGKIWQADYLKGLAKSPELLARVQTATDARLSAYAAGKSHP